MWPDLSSDISSVLHALPTDGLIEGVWQDKEGHILSAIADEDWSAVMPVGQAPLMSRMVAERPQSFSASSCGGESVYEIEITPHVIAHNLLWGSCV